MYIPNMYIPICIYPHIYYMFILYRPHMYILKLPHMYIPMYIPKRNGAPSNLKTGLDLKIKLVLY